MRHGIKKWLFSASYKVGHKKKQRRDAEQISAFIGIGKTEFLIHAPLAGVPSPELLECRLRRFSGVRKLAKKSCYLRENAAYRIEDMPYLLTVAEAAKILRCGKTKVYELANTEKDFPAIRLSGAIRIQRDGLIRWLEERMKGGKDNADID